MKRLLFTLAALVMLGSAAPALASGYGFTGDEAMMLAAADKGAPADRELEKKWDALKPEEKRRLLESYDKKKGLSEDRAQRREDRRKAYEEMSPEEQERFRRRMDRIREMSPEDRERMMKRMEKMREMSPEEWKSLREKAERFRALPQDRKDEIRGKLDAMDKLSPDERKRAREGLRKELEKEGILLPRRGRGDGMRGGSGSPGGQDDGMDFPPPDDGMDDM